MANEDSNTQLIDVTCAVKTSRRRRNINRARWINGQLIDVDGTDKSVKSYAEAVATTCDEPMIGAFASQFDENKTATPPSPVLSPQPDPSAVPPELSMQACPWSQNGRLIGVRHFGPFVRNPLKTTAVRFVDAPKSPREISEPTRSGEEIATLSVGQSTTVGVPNVVVLGDAGYCVIL